MKGFLPFSSYPLLAVFHWLGNNTQPLPKAPPPKNIDPVFGRRRRKIQKGTLNIY